jgi:CarD family transcriptional regulator
LQFAAKALPWAEVKHFGLRFVRFTKPAVLDAVFRRQHGFAPCESMDGQGFSPQPEDRRGLKGQKMSTKKTSVRQGFKVNERVVYPSHGVGQITSIDEQEIAGFKLELFVIYFPKEKMTLRVPTSKIASVGMRKLSELHVVQQALDVLTGRARIKRTMWSRRAQEYESKINSGDIIATAEVVRDLYRSEAQPEQSYSERQLYEAALARLVDEIAAVDDVTETEALKKIEASLAKNPRRAKATAEDESNDDAEIDEEAA